VKEEGDFAATNVSALRVMRGGSWVLGPKFCRSASRGFSEPGERKKLVGLPPGTRAVEQLSAESVGRTLHSQGGLPRQRSLAAGDSVSS
jgi:hypothetical protein